MITKRSSGSSKVGKDAFIYLCFKNLNRRNNLFNVALVKIGTVSPKKRLL